MNVPESVPKSVPKSVAKSVTVRVPAKINLQLSVGPVRQDGFHELVTVFCTLGLYDEVTLTAADQLQVTVDGPYAAGVPTDDTNLAVRAVRLLAAEAGLPPAVRVQLHKGIPVAGGLAGGSADAAGALLAASSLWGLDLPGPHVMDLAAQLGSDVPFALLGGVAVGRGRGEQLTAVRADATFWWVVVVADGGLSTPAVYAECDRLRADAEVPPPEVSAGLLEALAAGDAKRLAAYLSNDLQSAACSLRPSLQAVLQAGCAAGALAVIVSGSGPTCVFLAADEAAARSIVHKLGKHRDVHAAVSAPGPAGAPTVMSSEVGADVLATNRPPLAAERTAP